MKSWHERVLAMIPSRENRFRWVKDPATTEEHKIVPLKLGKHLTAKLVTAISSSRNPHHSVPWITALLFMIYVIFLADIATGPQISMSIFYLIPVALATWQFKRKIGVVLSFICATAWGTADILAGNTYPSAIVPLWNAAVRLGFFLIVTYMLSMLDLAMEQAQTDVLTGILNLRGFREQAERELARCARESHGFSLVYFDLDDFKRINNQLGHRYGDAALHRVGQVLSKCVRRTDVAARVGGDEFVVLYPAADYMTANIIVANLHAALRQAFAANERPITFSIGVATFDSIPESLDSALNEADALMYISKQNGKAQVSRRKVASPAPERLSG